MKKIKLKLSQIEQSMAPFSRLLDQRLRPKIAFRLGKFSRKFGLIYKELSKRRLDIFKMYGEENKKGGTFSVSPESEKHKDFKRDIEELFSEEVEVEIPEILIGDLESAGVEMSTVDVMALGWLIKE